MCVWCMCGACMFMCGVCVYMCECMYVVCVHVCVEVCVCVTLLPEIPENFFPLKKITVSYRKKISVGHVSVLSVGFCGYKFVKPNLTFNYISVIGHKLFLQPTFCGKYYLWISYHHINYRGIK